MLYDRVVLVEEEEEEFRVKREDNGRAIVLRILPGWMHAIAFSLVVLFCSVLLIGVHAVRHNNEKE